MDGPNSTYSGLDIHIYIKQTNSQIYTRIIPPEQNTPRIHENGRAGHFICNVSTDLFNLQPDPDMIFYKSQPT